MINTFITGLGPFTAESSFTCATLTIPRGLFLGGRLYLVGDLEAPFHISYIAPGDATCDGIWGVADNAGSSAGTILFNGLQGDIYALNGDYAGCIKGRNSLYNDSLSGGMPSLEVFLQSISEKHELDVDTLVWDISWCTNIFNDTAAPALSELELPEGAVLRALDDNKVTIDSISAYSDNRETQTATPLKSLTLGDSVVLSAPHIIIEPMTRDNDDLPVGIGDVIVSEKAGDLIICTHGRYDG